MKKILFFLLPVVLVGCEKEKITENPDPENIFVHLTEDEARLLAENGMPLRFDADEIDRIVAEVIALMEPGEATRAGSTGDSGSSSGGRRVGEIRPLYLGFPASGLTRSGENSNNHPKETLFHVVNFEGERGYCIVAADRRIPDQIVCFVEHGSFPDTPPGQPIENPGLRLMMDAVAMYADRSIDRHEKWCDSVSSALLARTGAASIADISTQVTRATGTRAAGAEATDTTDTSTETETETADTTTAERYEPSWYINRRIGPLLPVEWDQRSPFNTTVVENTRWSNTPVGCVAVAAVGIMAYWGHPVNFHGLAEGNIDWDELVRWSGSRWDRETGYRDWDGPMSAAPEETRKLVADIFWHVGDDIDMNYGSTVSTAYSYKATELLADYGFSKANIVSYTHETVLESISARRPVMIDGASHLTEDGTYYSNAHAWVIDGYLEQRWWDAYYIDRHLYEIEKFRGFFHNNFGWGGLDNGYYACGMFDANNNPDHPSDTRANARLEWMGQSYNYQFLLTVYTGIYK